MEVQSWQQVANGLLATADGAALASSTALTVISPNSATNPPIVFGPNTVFPGAAMRVTAQGRFSNTGTPTLNLGLYWGGAGGVALATTGAITTTSGVTNIPWWAELIVVVRGIGTSGTFMTIGWARGISGTGGVSTVPMPASAPAPVTVDTTTARSLDFCAQWGTSSASNTITCHTLLVEALNFNPV